MTSTPEVSERARALREAVEREFRLHTADVDRCLIGVGLLAPDASRRATRSIRAIVTKLGITQEMLERLRRLERFAEAAEEWDHRDTASDAVDFAATLLAAGGSDD